jgi:2'-5' RNA ligase
MRLFAAIAAEGAVREALVQAQAELRRLGRGSFPRPEMLHLTLAFLGEVPGDAPPGRRWKPCGNRPLV